MRETETTRNFARAFKEKGYPIDSCTVVLTICGSKEMRTNYAPYYEALKRVTEFTKTSNNVDEVIKFALNLAKIEL